MPNSQVIIRLATVDDLAEIEAIEVDSNLIPWTKQALSTSLNLPNQLYVLINNNQIEAYLIGLVAGDEASLLHIVVKKRSQGLGLGSQCLIFWLEYLRKLGCIKECWLEVRRSNLVAQNVYEKFGFKQISVRKGYYVGIPEPCDRQSTVAKNKASSREDALIYRLTIK